MMGQAPGKAGRTAVTQNDATPTGPGSWKLALGNGRQMSASVQIDGGWMNGLAELQIPKGWDAMSLLEWNGRWPGSTRLGWGGGAGRIQLRQELYMGESAGEESAGEPDAMALLDRIGDDFVSARDSLESGWARDCSDSGNEDPFDASELAEWCEDAGWSVSRKEGAAFSVDLGDASGYYEAQWRQTGSIRCFSVPLAPLEASSAESVDATAVLMLLASGVCRLLRGTMEAAADSVVPLLEVRPGATLSVGALDRSLSALSLAVRVCGREAEALQDPALARDFMNLSGSRTPPGAENRRNDR